MQSLTSIILFLEFMEYWGMLCVACQMESYLWSYCRESFDRNPTILNYFPVRGSVQVATPNRCFLGSNASQLWGRRCSGTTAKCWSCWINTSACDGSDMGLWSLGDPSGPLLSSGLSKNVFGGGQHNKDKRCLSVRHDKVGICYFSFFGSRQAEERVRCFCSHFAYLGQFAFSVPQWIVK